jgi:alkylhydroperoxidase family enzyme
MTVKTAMSRFHIHDELTAPEGSVPILKRVAGGGEVSKFIGVLAGSPTVLRAYARMRSELRDGVLPAATRHRIALAAAERRGDTYGVGTYAKAARAAGLGLDEISKARSFTSADPREAALLTFLEDAIDPGPPELHLLEEAREVGWSDEQLLEALAQLALAEFESLFGAVAALPRDHSAPQVLPSAA